ncbi:hypothetical protein PO909_015903 [Leuciscus waleckii]
MRGDMPDVLKVKEAYEGFSPDIVPVITTMSISADVPLVESALGKVQEGSLTSYQQPVPVSHIMLLHIGAPPPPPLPLDGYRLEFTYCQFVCSLHQQLHMQSLQANLEMARGIEVATRDRSMSVEWHRVRKMRLASSHFREVCHVRGQTSAEHLADRMFRSVTQTSVMKRGLALEPLKSTRVVKLMLYQQLEVFMENISAPWLGSSPDGVVFDPTDNPPFGLLGVKCKMLC